MIIYTLISVRGKREDIIVLNRNYTKEQLKEKLGKENNLEYERIEKGTYLSKGETLKIKFQNEGFIYTRYNDGYGCVGFCKRDKAIIFFDGKHKRKQGKHPFLMIRHLTWMKINRLSNLIRKL